MKLRNQSCQLILGHYSQLILGHFTCLFLSLGLFFLYVEKKIPSLGNKIPSFGIDDFISGVCYLMALRGVMS